MNRLLAGWARRRCPLRVETAQIRSSVKKLGTAFVCSLLLLMILWRVNEYYGVDSLWVIAQDRPADVTCSRTLLGQHYFGDFFSLWCQLNEGPYGVHDPPASQFPLSYLVTRTVISLEEHVALLVLVGTPVIGITYTLWRNLRLGWFAVMGSAFTPVLIAIDRGNFGWLFVLWMGLHHLSSSNNLWRVLAISLAVSLKPLVVPFFLAQAILRRGREEVLILLSALVVAPIISFLSLVLLRWPISSVRILLTTLTNPGPFYDTPLTRLPVATLFKHLSGDSPYTLSDEVSFLFLGCLSILCAVGARRARRSRVHFGSSIQSYLISAAIGVWFVPNTYGWIVFVIPLVAALAQEQMMKARVILSILMVMPALTIEISRISADMILFPCYATTLLLLSMSFCERASHSLSAKLMVSAGDARGRYLL